MTDDPGLAAHPQRVLRGPAAPDWRGEIRVGRTSTLTQRSRVAFCCERVALVKVPQGPMILGWAQTQPSGRVVTHLHWVPRSLPRMCAPCRLGRRPPLTAGRRRRRPPPPASPPPVVGRRLLRGLPRGYCEATTRPPRGLLRGYYLILSRHNGTVTAPIRCKKRHARFRPAACLFLGHAFHLP